MHRFIDAVPRHATWMLLGLVLAVDALALPPAGSLNDAAAGDLGDVVAADRDGAVGDDAARDDGAPDRDVGEDKAPADAARAAPKRRPGVKQIEAPGALDAELEDPEAARRAQLFGALPAFPVPGMPFPGFPPGAFPFGPRAPGGAAANAGGAGGAQQFGFTGAVIVGGNAAPGGNGFVVRTWQIGPDGAMVEMPPVRAPADEPGQRRGARPRGAIERGQGGAKKTAPDAAGKAGRAARAKKAAPPRGAADER